MPVIKIYTLSDTQIYIWIIKESTKELLEYAKAYKLNNFNNITHKHRLKQFIAARITLAKALNLAYIPELIKTPAGKPIFKNLDTFFSIGHSNNFVVVGISKYEIGIDIQAITSKLYSIRDKFLCKDEQNILLNKTINFNYLLYLKQLCVCWTSKEALYKLLNKQNISLKENIKIIHINSKDNCIQLDFVKNNINKTFNSDYLFINNCYISYALNKHET